MTDEKYKALDTQVGGDHYKHFKIQPIEFIIANRIEGAESYVIKYVCRWRNKNGVEDLRKARHTLDIMIQEEEAATAEPENGDWMPRCLEDGAVSVSYWMNGEKDAKPVTLNAAEMAMASSGQLVQAVTALRDRIFATTEYTLGLKDAVDIVAAYRASIKASEPPPVKRDHSPTWCVYHGGLVRHRRDVIDTTWQHYHGLRRTFTTRAAAREFARKEKEASK